MRTVELYGQRVTVAGGPLAIWTYQREFGSDLWADLRASTDGWEVSLAIWLQIMWAMARTADPDFMEFHDFLASFGDFDLGDAKAIGVMDSAISAGFFRRRPTRRIERVRQRISRWLGGLSRRVGGPGDGAVAR